MDTVDFEKLGQLYLGREYDLERKTSDGGALVLYDSKDLVTHAVVVGMTGSGKTGLCIDLIEEAAIDGVPAIAIDPKGDLTNLLLTFPDLRPEDFRPWVNEDDAARGGVSPDEYAKQQAQLWREGLAAWGQDGERIRRLKDAADFAIYTPGSTAGIPVSILRSFAAPPERLREDGELFRERVATTATSLLALVGVAVDPIKSREHVLVSTLLSNAWSDGRDLDLTELVQQVQRPPAGIERIGALDVEKFYPAKDRDELATRINALIASPGFAGWLEGEPLDIGAMFRTSEGKPRVSIFSIAHLGEAERVFFVALLLNEVLGWTRTQTGTSSLRAILYMDEIFGFFPPVAEPPSKRPLITLLKEARAFGVGVVLATQNPVDLDYKGLQNTGTWLVGRLQTERDKARLLEGLEGAAAASSATFDRRSMEELLAGLQKRVFLMNNVHDEGPTVFETRWAMSYLRGPLTREQIKLLMQGRRPERSTVPAPARQERAEDDQRTRERRDAAIEELRAKYGPKIRRAQEKARRAAQVVEREEGQLRGAGAQTAVSVGATILTAIFGRGRGSYSTIGRGTTAARGAARALEQREDVKRAKENLEAAQDDLADLEAELEEKIADLRET